MVVAKEYLQRTDGLQRYIDRLRLEAEQLKLESQSVQTVEYGERISSPNRNTEAPFVRSLLKAHSLEEKAKATEEVLIALKMEISDAIDKLDCVDERILLRARYINGCTWDEISNQLNYSLRSTHRIHAQALRHFVVPK